MTTGAAPDAAGTGPHRVVSVTPRRRIRWFRTVLIAAASLVVAVIVAGLPLYVFPPQGDPSGANLVYVIGPPRAPRIDVAQQLRDADTQPLPTLLSVSNTTHGNSRFDARAITLCHESAVTCETPKPFTTKGEARMLTDYAATHSVGKTVVITFTPHVARTRYIFAKCYAGDVSVVGVDEHLSLWDWVYQYAYQTAAFVKAWLGPCP